MTATYLTSTFADKDRVKALGGRWDPERRQWYVPEGRDCAPFAQWLPMADAHSAAGSAVLATTSAASSHELAVDKQRGVSLSHLLQGVSAAVAQAFKAGVWTMIEVVDTRVRNGHVYLEVSERDTGGTIVAKANAVIWASTAAQILPTFEAATGAQVGPGIKLLVRARPVFKPQYGFSLEVDAIDPDYTLGDLEARKREIRERLQREGLFDLNRQLPTPWDYNLVLVVAPEGGAGLGDFQAEANRLQKLGICRFIYVHSRFQGDGAAEEIRREMLDALKRQREGEHGDASPDAVAIIRGGGAINDMAWLNDYALVRAVCELGVPVLTGIGHERDSTVLDEVAHVSFDTPSKVIAGIERQILQRVREAKGLFAEVIRDATRAVGDAQRTVVERYAGIEAGSRQEVARSRQHATELLAQAQLDATHALHFASEGTKRQMNDVVRLASQQLSHARSEVPSMLAEIRAEGRQSLQMARVTIQTNNEFVLNRANVDLRYVVDAANRAFDDIAAHSRQLVVTAKTDTQALMREIAGQGPNKTLNRGFALVRDSAGKAITSAASPEAHVSIEFRDGVRDAQLQQANKP